jgi:hypothetical protein
MKTEDYFILYLVCVALAFVLVLVQRYVIEAKEAPSERMTGSEMLTWTILGPATLGLWLYKLLYDTAPEPPFKV